jgi:hypothetical protein
MKLVTLFALAITTSIAAAACASNTDADESTATAQDQDLRKSLQACNTDDDCVAVPRGGCCSNGWLEAVNKHHVKAYANATKCTHQNMACPMYVVHDTRVAECDGATKKCEMVQPEDIRCGGFMAPAFQHSCPDGYSCQHTGMNPDLPGKCVETPPPSDCSASACDASK